MRQRRANFEYASLREHFNYTTEDIGLMTRKQIVEQCYHYRNKNGQLVIKAEATYKPDIRALQKIMGFSEEDYNKIIAAQNTK